MYIIITKDILQNTLEDSSFLENVHKTQKRKVSCSPFPQLWTFELKLIWQLNYCSRLAGKIKFKVKSEIPHKEKLLFFFKVCWKTEKGKGRSNLRCQNLWQHLYCCSDIKWAGIVCGLFYPQSAQTHNSRFMNMH